MGLFLCLSHISVVILVFIMDFIGLILPKKYCQKWEVQKKIYDGEVAFRRGTLCSINSQKLGCLDFWGNR